MTSIEAMTKCWQRVLGRKPIRPQDDFFDLGGNCALAAQLVAEIQGRLGVELPLTAICRASTIESLTSWAPQAIDESRLIPLRAGDGLPVFMTHGIGSSVVELMPLVRSIQGNQPIYGLEARGNDGREDPSDSIEGMAQDCLALLRKVQPNGPCLLIGYSLGGLVTLEMARSLRSEQRRIALLTLLDSYPDRHALSFNQHARLAIRLAKQQISRSFLPIKKDSPKNLSNVVEGAAVSDALQRTKLAHYRALRAYRPRYYDGAVQFVTASKPTQFPSDPIPVWSPLIRELRVQSVEGDHSDMLRGQALALGAMLTGYIQEATDKR